MAGFPPVKARAALQTAEKWGRTAAQNARGTESRNSSAIDILPNKLYLSTMSLNIKNPEAHRLATELARATGKSLTQAVTDALRESLERTKAGTFDQKKFDALKRIADDCASRLSQEAKDFSINETLYDELGLPK